MQAIPKTMKAVVLQEPHRLTVEQIPVPEILPHEILLKVGACAMCGSDLEAFWGIHPSVKSYPVVLGHEFAGTVVAVGSKVTKYKVGDRICHTGGRVRVCEARLSGNHRQCPERKGAGSPPTAPMPSTWPCWATTSTAPLPDNLSMAQGALAQPFGDGYHAATGKARAQAGETIVAGLRPHRPLGHDVGRSAARPRSLLTSRHRLTGQAPGADYTINVTGRTRWPSPAS